MDYSGVQPFLFPNNKEGIPLLDIFGRNSIELTGNSNENNYFSIFGPGTIRSNTTYKFAVSIHRAENPCKIRISIVEGLMNVITSTEREFQPMSLEYVIFDIPKLKGGVYTLKAEGLSNLLFRKSCVLNVVTNSPTVVVIQTDKAMYKPGDLVQFRILFMDEYTCPKVPREPAMIRIRDGNKNILKQWKDIKLTKGVYADKYQLSEQPVLGQWLIEVYFEESIVETKHFEVAKYVLPKFSVTIETAKNVFASGVLNLTVRAKYTYGKGVKGKAHISINPKMGLYRNSTIIKKTINIDGKGEAEINYDRELFNLIFNNKAKLGLNISAVVEDELTGNKQESSETVHLHKQNYLLILYEKTCEFSVGQPIKIRISVRNLENIPISDKKNYVKLELCPKRGLSHTKYWEFMPATSKEEKSASEKSQENPIELLANLDDDGVASFEYTIVDENIEAYDLECSYLDCKKNFGSITKMKRKNVEVEPLKLIVATKNPKLDKPVKILIKSIEEMSYYVYAIMGRGKLLKADLVELPHGTKEHSFEVTPTFDMAPNAYVFVHYMAGQKMCFNETSISFETNFSNKISITTPEEGKPSEEILLQINTTSDSFVGLLGVDQSTLLLKSENDLEKRNVFEKLRKIDSKSPREMCYPKYPGFWSGLFTLTNINLNLPEPKINYLTQKVGGQLFGSSPSVNQLPTSTSIFFGSPSAVGNIIPVKKEEKLPSIKVRKEFPETWIFDNIQSTENDILCLSKKLPDTITSWVITGFSLNPKYGLGITESSTTIRTFRPFFISTNLPYSVRRGEQIAIPVLLFNYTDQDLHTEVTLENLDDEFEFSDMSKDQKNCIKSILVKSNIGSSISFPIRPRKCGHITLKISARSALAGDAIHKKLRVEPEGITIYKNKELYLSPGKENLNTQTTLKLDIPADVIADSEIIEVSLTGNTLGSTISNLDNLVRMPCGCGEQNMVNFVPNIFVLWYLESINKVNPSIESKAKRFLEVGYQRELTYKHNDGSYSAFGQHDPSGSTWLTAYVVRSFYQAKKYIHISQSVLDEGLNFLARKQLPSGCFSEVGKVVDFSHMNEIGLTAFVLLAFLENRESLVVYKTVVERGLEFLEQNFDSTDDLYALSITLYALQQFKSSVASKLLEKLETLSHIDKGYKWWSSSGDKAKTIHKNRNSHDVEITGYMCMTLLETNAQVVPILKWIISQRNGNGGFGSTQETVVGLWALIKFVQKYKISSPDINVEVSSQSSHSSAWKVHINEHNFMVVQSLEMPKNTREISFTAKGTGEVVFQLAYRFNIFDKEKQPSFQLQTKIKPALIPKRMYLDVLIAFLPKNSEETISNMVVMEVKLPTGFTASTEIFEEIQKIKNIKRVESKNEGTEIIVYFEHLKASEEVCIPIEAELFHEVTGQKPVPIVIYDYYEIQKRAVIFYQFENKIMEVAEV